MPTAFEDLSDQPLDDFEGLRPGQVHRLLHNFLDRGSIVRLSDADVPPPAAMPLVHFVRDLLDRLAERDIPLTKKGNLPAGLVKEWYATGLLPARDIDSGITKLSGEDDYLPAQVAKHLPLVMGWTKKRHNKLSLTAKGKKARALSEHAFFATLFRQHLKLFNLGWADGYPESSALQHVFGYLAYLLLLFGTEERPATFYGERLRRAFPLLERDFPGTQLTTALQLRLLEHYLAYYGLIGVKPNAGGPYHSPGVGTTIAFRKLFYLDRGAAPDPPTEEENYERQLRTALFDAEMGSQSYTSDELPLEMLEAFQEQVRQFEEQQAAQDTVTVRSLLGDMPILLPSDIPDNQIATREARRLTEALERVGILLVEDEAKELEPKDYYDYLHNLLLDFEIVPPPPGSRRALSFSEVVIASMDPIEALTEHFLLSLFRLDVPFPVDLLATEMRLANRLVPRQRGLDHLLNWRRQWREIVGLAFDVIDGPQVEPPTDRQAIQFYLVAYEVVNAASGEKEVFEGGGVMEFILEGEEWRVTGAQFPGFCL